MYLRILLLAVAATTLLLGGCDGGTALTLPATNSSPGTSVDNNGLGHDQEDDREELVIAWLLSDQDGDGLPTGFELDFGLDPDDPTDGPDIDGDGLFNFEDPDVDGDGYLNATDPDIDGDGVFNGYDDDIDGDGVPNEIDFDMDGDGTRDEWDLDFDADGIEGEVLIETPDFVAQEFLEEATAIIEGDADGDGDGGDENDDGNAFEAYVAYLVSKGDAWAQDKLAGLLRQASARHPIKTDSYEAELIVEQFAKRFKDKSQDANEFLTFTLGELASARPGENGDATHAVEVLFRQARAVQNPGNPSGHDELLDRLQGLLAIVSEYGESDLQTCSDAIDDLFQMPGDGNLNQKLIALGELKAKFGLGTDLDTVMRTFDGVIAALETELFGQDWEWDNLIEAIQTAPNIDDNGNDFDLIDHIVGKLDDDDRAGADDDDPNPDP